MYKYKKVQRKLYPLIYISRITKTDTSTLTAWKVILTLNPNYKNFHFLCIMIENSTVTVLLIADYACIICHCGGGGEILPFWLLLIWN